MSRQTRLWGGAALALAVAIALLTRFSLDDTLQRDEAIYVYGGQQLAHGVPFYVSIFDPKTPLAAFIAAGGALFAHATGGYDVYTIRIVFFAFACAAIVGLYVVAATLFESVLAGLAAAVTMASFEGFARDALGGPDAKTPGIAFAMFAMALLLKKRWFAGGLLAALAFLTWQPLGIYMLIALAAPLVQKHWRGAAQALAGLALPIAAIAVYYIAKHATGDLLDATVRFPLEGVQRRPETLTQRLEHITDVISLFYGHTRGLFYAGLGLLLVLLAYQRRGRLIVGATALGLIAFSATDFQGYPDAYPLLPYAALGIGGAVAFLARGPLRRPISALALAGTAALAVLSFSWYGRTPPLGPGLPAQRADARALAQTLGRHGRLYALGNPAPLVLTNRRNPNRYIYLASGVAGWVVDHTRDGMHGWQDQIEDAHPKAIVVNGWTGERTPAMYAWLKHRYGHERLGRWLVFVPPHPQRSRLSHRASHPKRQAGSSYIRRTSPDPVADPSRAA
jgi:hypothetical protein